MIKPLISIFLFITFVMSAMVAQAEVAKHSTWTLVARDTQMGIVLAASSSRYFNVIHRICRARAGVGLVISKARGNPEYFEALDMLENGRSAAEVLAQLRIADTLGPSEASADRFRQVVVMPADGPIASFTGAACGEYAGQRLHKDFVVLGNGLENKKVLDAMEHTYLSAKGPFWRRIIATMEAGYRAGGEVRPENSAGVCYTTLEPASDWWAGGAEYISVAESSSPIEELGRLLEHEQTRLLLEEGFASFEIGKVAAGNEAFVQARKREPENLEISAWHGFFLYKAGEKQRGLNVLKDALAGRSETWPLEMLRRFGGPEGESLVEQYSTSVMSTPKIADTIER